jgi:Undecaprenyl-phosphate galactose phosphotransferase WbaP
MQSITHASPRNQHGTSFAIRNTRRWRSRVQNNFLTLAGLAMSAMLRSIGSRVEISAATEGEPQAIGRWTTWRRWLLMTSPLIIADLMAVSSTLVVVNGAMALLGLSHFAFRGADIISLSAAVVLSQALFGIYRENFYVPVVELRSMTAGTSVIFMAYLLLGTSGITRSLAFCAAWMCCLISVPATRWLVRRYLSGREWWGQPVLIFGNGQAGCGIYQALQKNPEMGLRPVAVVGHSDEPFEDLASVDVGRWEDAAELATRHSASTMIMAMADCPGTDTMSLIEQHARVLTNRVLVPDMGNFPCLWATATNCGGLIGIQSTEQLSLPGPRLAKRLIDGLLTLIVLIGSLPLLLIISLIVRLTSKGPVFYSQPRLGLNGTQFRAWKFRTMVANADVALAKHLAANLEARREWEQDHKLKKDPRITGIGRLLRKTSLDELPQLWNVLRGEMSLVGPRPIIEDEIRKYADAYEIYSRVRPGITGLWQISGRNNTTYGERVELDVFYVRNWSLWLDLYILVSTVRVVVLQEGAY